MNNSNKVQQKLTDLYGGFIVGAIIGILVFATFYLLALSGKPGGHPQTYGWAKIRPISASISYKSNGSFEATFQNTVGTSILLTSIVMSETLTPTPNNCNLTNVSGTAWVEGNSELKVKAGDGLEIVAICPAKSEGDPFDLEINMAYTAVMGGVNTSNSERGRIKDCVGCFY